MPAQTVSVDRVFHDVSPCVRCSPDVSVMLRTYSLNTNTLLFAPWLLSMCMK